MLRQSSGPFLVQMDLMFGSLFLGDVNDLTLSLATLGSTMLSTVSVDLNSKRSNSLITIASGVSDCGINGSVILGTVA